MNGYGGNATTTSIYPRTGGQTRTKQTKVTEREFDDEERCTRETVTETTETVTEHGGYGYGYPTYTTNLLGFGETA